MIRHAALALITAIPLSLAEFGPTMAEEQLGKVEFATSCNEKRRARK